MQVTFHHTQCYSWETIQSADAQDGDVLGTNLQGETVRRITVPSPYTEVGFVGGAVDQIHAERDEAGLPARPDNRVIAQHLEDTVPPLHFDIADVTDITVEPPDDDLRAYLLAHFGVTS